MQRKNSGNTPDAYSGGLCQHVGFVLEHRVTGPHTVVMELVCPGCGYRKKLSRGSEVSKRSMDS